MPPHVEWHVTDRDASAVIVKTESRPPSRWRKWSIVIVIVIGAGLMAAYTSRPQTAAAPAPPPTPTEIPLPPLAPVIDREARALASGDMQAFVTLHDPVQPDWRQERLTTFEVWGAPPGDDQFYAVLDSGRTGPMSAWADVIQYRNGQYFRETRFYRLFAGRWVRTVPDRTAAFWGDQIEAQTDHFELVFRQRDEEAARFLADQLEARYAQVCVDFNCNGTEADERYLKLVLEPGVQIAARGNRQGNIITVTLPAPSLTGLYYAALDTGEPGRNPQIDAIFSQHVLYPILYYASGGLDRWVHDRGGIMYVWAFGAWERIRRGLLPADELIPRPDVLRAAEPIPLDQLWAWSTDLYSRDLIRNQAAALIQFIDETYGPEQVLAFFRALRHAQSLPHWIEVVGLPYSEFEAKWAAWLKNYRAADIQSAGFDQTRPANQSTN